MAKRDHVQLSRQAYNRLASDYEASPEGKFTRAYKELILSSIQLGAGEALLDVACGPGDLLKMISKRNKGVELFGVDVAEQMVAVAQSQLPMARIEVADASDLPFSNDVFDWITVSASFHHFPDPQAFLRESVRTLKSSGTLVIAELSYPTPLRQVANLFLPLSKSGDVRMYSHQEFFQLFSKCGLEEVGYEKQDYIQLISAKPVFGS